MQLLFRLVGRYLTDRTACQLQPCCCSGLQKVACFGSCSETLKCFMSMWLFTLKCKAQNKINQNTFVLIVRKETWLAAFSVASVAAGFSPSLSLILSFINVSLCLLRPSLCDHRVTAAKSIGNYHLLQSKLESRTTSLILF